MRIDLHTHSSCSDGTDTPTELIRKAKVAGLDVVAITDHDTTSGWAEAERAAGEQDIVLVKGIELSTDNQGQSQHLLAYEIDPDHAELVQVLERGRLSRDQRIPKTLELLGSEGAPVTEDQVRAEAKGESLGRPHVADALVRAGHVADRQEAFDRYLGEGMPAYVSRQKLSIEEAIRIVRAAGGVTVVAHPRARGAEFGAVRFAELRDLGLGGIEVDHELHDERTRADLRAIAAELNLVATGSSDYHGTGKKGHPLGCNLTNHEAWQSLRGRREVR